MCLCWCGCWVYYYGVDESLPLWIRIYHSREVKWSLWEMRMRWGVVVFWSVAGGAGMTRWMECYMHWWSCVWIVRQNRKRRRPCWGRSVVRCLWEGELRCWTILRVSGWDWLGIWLEIGLVLKNLWNNWGSKNMYSEED